MSDYYTVAYHEFLTESFTAAVTAGGNYTVAEPFTFTPTGTVSGNLVAIPNLGCDAVRIIAFPWYSYYANRLQADYTGIDVNGKIALVSRGTCTFAIKTLLASSNGAVGTIIYNNAAGVISGGTLGAEDPNYDPTAWISQAAGLALVEKLKTSTVFTELVIVRAQLPTYNVCAQTKGGDQNNVLVAGAHSDSVKAGKL